MANGHAHHDHDHDHGPPATTAGTRRWLTGAVLAVVLAAVIGLVLLWPGGDRPNLAVDLGLDVELYDATVISTDVGPCEGTDPAEGVLCEQVAIRVTSGGTEGDESVMEQPIAESSADLDEGDDIVVTYQPELEEPYEYRYYDHQRAFPLLVLWTLFVVAVVALGRWQGVRALAALCVTGVVMVGFMFPSILDGNDPTSVALVTAAIIGLAALYLTHGVNERTTVALLGTFGALGLTAILSAVFSSAASFSGFSTEDAYYLQVASAQVDVAGLVLAGIIIGSLGVLDDVTVTQVSAVWQLHRADPTAGVRQLYGRAVTIGRDHIASTVNTLVLAYAGASLPLLLLYTQAGRSLGEVAQGEVVAVEIVRTLVGSIGLVAAVPVTTGLAALVITRGASRAAPTQPPIATDEAAGTDASSEDDEWDRFAPESEGW
jgi:uncharacterized membrane protein